MYQAIAWQITLLLVSVVLFIFAYVALHVSPTEEYIPIQRTAARLRGILFWGLVIFFVPVIVYSLSDLPYYPSLKGVGTPQVVDVIGYQWRWNITPNRVIAQRPVEFRVTGGDVNHGFGLYDANLRLITQTQAMPGYTNVVYHTFAAPGTYRVLCLEYCGLAHHGMMAEIVVVANN
jgi:cytochrome c oxidase subunit II